MSIRVSRFKTFNFRRHDGAEISKDVPTTLDQSLVRDIDFEDYLIRVIAVTRKIAESEFATFTGKNGKYVGCLIPSNAILSEENPNNTNKVFAAYSLIVAANVCAASYNGQYQLVAAKNQDAAHMSDLFSENFFYAIFKKSSLDLRSRSFDRILFRLTLFPRLAYI